ncbi:MAG: hypothetical protein CUN52_02685 [Phototrophicales bacterium]|jgi:hypothetical protein|nr:MAG: hypothetical protein CUN52_02685 [Phototrophicales bacterium]
MRRGLPTLFGLLVIFIVLAILVVIQEPRNPSAIQPTAQPTDQTNQGFGDNRVYIGLDASAIQAIRLLDPNSGQSVTFARNPIRLWTLPFIEGVSLDQTAMQDIERTLVIMPYAHQFIPEAQRLTEYGFLSDGRHYFSVLFTMDDGTTHTISIGNPTEFNGRAVYYAVVDEREEMYLIYREPIDFLTQQFLKPPIVS